MPSPVSLTEKRSSSAPSRATETTTGGALVRCPQQRPRGHADGGQRVAQVVRDDGQDVPAGRDLQPELRVQVHVLHGGSGECGEELDGTSILLAERGGTWPPAQIQVTDLLLLVANDRAEEGPDGWVTFREPHEVWIARHVGGAHRLALADHRAEHADGARRRVALRQRATDARVDERIERLRRVGTQSERSEVRLRHGAG